VFVVYEGEKISSVNAFLVLTTEQLVQATSDGVAKGVEEENHDFDEGGSEIGNLVFMFASRQGHGHDFCDHEYHDSGEKDGCPVGHNEMDDEGQGLKNDGVSDQESDQEEVVVVDHSQNASGQSLALFVFLLLHYLEVQDTEGVEADRHAGAEATSKGQD
jgi:hypothetical protein